MNQSLKFETRAEFRNWLKINCMSSSGVWLLFGKTTELITLKPSEALEEALCFGWIDGTMKKIDNKSYIKYFSIRRKNSNWSDKNKSIVADLKTKGLIADFGREKIEEAKKNGQWNKVNQNVITEEQIECLIMLLKEYKTAYDNFQKMSPSVQKTYTRAYFNAKTETGRTNRLSWIIERLEKNLKPM